MSTGIAFFAYNTENIDYMKLSIIAARYVRRYMPGRNICLITDAGTWEWFNASPFCKYIAEAFDDVSIVEASHQVNIRTHHDSPYHRFKSNFKNGNKHKIIEYTPYDKTLLLDIDYIVQNNSLDYVFGSDSAVTLFHNAESLTGLPPISSQQYLSDAGIPMIWSTAIYFDKHNELAQMFFDIWAHVSENYEFYQFLYGFPGHMYRTDFCVSIASHIMNGMGTGDIIDDFPVPMINMSQFDDVVKINKVDEWAYLVNDRQENWKNTLLLSSRENVHVMNKSALERQFDSIMEALDE